MLAACFFLTGAGCKQNISPFKQTKPFFSEKFQPGTRAFYVALEGDDKNNGGITHPWASIQHAADMAMPGDTIWIREGFFTIREPIRLTHSGTPTAWIHFAAYPGERVVIDAREVPVGPPRGKPPYPHDQGAFQIQNVGYIRVEGLTVQNARSAGFTVRDSHHVDLYHNETRRTFSSGIAVWDSQNDHQGTEDIRIMGNRITQANTEDLLPVGMRRQKETPHEAISIGGAQHFQVAFNHIFDCFKEGIDIKETSGFGKIHHNHIHHVKRQGLYVDSWFGMLSHIEIWKNRIHHCKGAGIAISVENGAGLEDVDIRHNLIYENDGTGLFFSRWGGRRTETPHSNSQQHHLQKWVRHPQPRSSFLLDYRGGFICTALILKTFTSQTTLSAKTAGFKSGAAIIILKMVDAWRKRC